MGREQCKEVFKAEKDKNTRKKHYGLNFSFKTLFGYFFGTTKD